MQSQRVISAKIEAWLFKEIDELREELGIKTRQEFVDRSLRHFVRISSLPEESIQEKDSQYPKSCLLAQVARGEGPEGPKTWENGDFSDPEGKEQQAPVEGTT